MIIKKVHGILFLLVVCGWLMVTLCFAQPVSSTELINNAKQYDGKKVVYEGEVIGEIMLRKDFAWLNVNDGNSAIGVWAQKGLIKDIFYTGSYKVKGDWIEIAGIFNRACLTHGGDLDVHAQGIKKIDSGQKYAKRLDLDKKNTALILLGALSIVWISRQLKRK